jgi:hypothetical protein
MAIAIPNLKIKAILEILVGVVRADYSTKKTANLESESWLYRCFNGIKYGNFDYYKQAIEILINRDQNNIKQLNIRNGFSLVDKPNTPTIHIHVPGEQQGGVNAIGLNLDTNQFYENSVDTDFNEKYARSFEGDYDLMITSPNYDEVELLYRFLQALFISAGDTFNENFDGVFKFSGKQIIVNPDTMPTPMFIKVWSIKIQQTITVPILPISEYLGKAEFYGHFVAEDYGTDAIGINEL